MNNRVRLYMENISVIPEFLVARLRGIGGVGAEDLHGVSKKAMAHEPSAECSRGAVATARNHTKKSVKTNG